jgi:bacillithiol biosynthesis cysteine-adding enzyme BshC
LDLTGIQDILAQTKDLPQNILDCYLSSKTLAEAHQRLVNELFGEYGIVILDPNHPKLKKSFLEFFNKEIDAQISYNHVTKTNQELENLGYKTQVSPRACNLFYQENGKRFRIEVTQNEIVLVDSGLKYSLADFKNKVAQNPELISQNVITRPIYQQQILPNIAYIGGPGELAYWLQLKSLFDSQNLAYPMLVSRFSALYLPSYLIDKMQKANLSIEKIFTPFDVLKQEIMSQDTGGEQIISQLNIGYDNYKNDICKNLESQQNLSLLTYAQSTLTRIEKEHQNIVKKVKKEIESRNSVQIERTKGVLDALFPNNELQERTECVFSFLINNSNFLDDLYHLINPFEYKFQILQS